MYGTPTYIYDFMMQIKKQPNMWANSRDSNVSLRYTGHTLVVTFTQRTPVTSLDWLTPTGPIREVLVVALDRYLGASWDGPNPLQTHTDTTINTYI